MYKKLLNLNTAVTPHLSIKKNNKLIFFIC